MAFDPAHREKRQKAGNDDRRGEEYGAVYFGCGVGDDRIFSVQAKADLRTALHDGRFVEARSMREMPEYILDHYHGRIDHKAEIDGSHRQQVCRFAAQDHDDHGEEQRKRYVGRHDDRAAQVA